MVPFFIEVGSCDFDTCLPLAKAGWSGVVVEAHPQIFMRVKEMFQGTNVQCVNYAVTDYNGVIDFKLSTGGGWARGISHVASDNHLGESLSSYAENKGRFGEIVSVAAITMDNLIDVCNVSSIDFLKIDVEGHELNLLNGYNFGVRPSFIKIEHKHVDDREIMRTLRSNKYMAWKEQDDIYAVG